MQKWFVGIGVGVFVVFGLLYLTNGEGRAKYQACKERGVAYYKNQGMYPTMKFSGKDDGRRVEDVAGERCQRTPAAYMP